MRPITLIVLVGGLMPGCLLAAPAMAQTCGATGHEQASTLLQQPYEFPIGRRFVVSDRWQDKPKTAGSGETRTTNAVFKQLGKLDGSHAVSMMELRHGRNEGWTKESWTEKVTEGVFTIIEVEPTGITSDPTYHWRGDHFVVNMFAFAGLQVVATNELHSATDRYCVVQFNFQISLNPLLAPLIDKPEVTARKGRLLSLWDPFPRRWRLVAADLSPRGQEFATEDVPTAAGALMPVR
jgi:hypothetical protein